MPDQTEEITTLTKQLATDSLALWSDEKRKVFVDTFDARVRAARYILVVTAQHVIHKAKEKHFISDKHLRKMDGFRERYGYPTSDLYDKKASWNDPSTVGGRPVKELDAIAEERASEIISQLPGLNEAVRIISPEAAKMIEQRSKLLAKGKELLDEAEELAGPLDVDDLDQAMTLAEFRQLVKNREKKRAAILTRLDETGDEGRTLDSKINKFLYDGLPGLSDAVVKVIKDYMERAAAFSTLNRRVSERVQFGDSEAAMEMLKTFEKDEAKVSDDVKAQFDKALDELKLAAKKGLSASRTKKLKT